MTQKELKHLSRSDLLEMLLELSKENETLSREVASLRSQLNDRNIALENCGSLAEASLVLNGVFQAVQDACDHYTRSIQERSENLEQHCRKMEQETREKCDAMLAAARENARTYIAEAREEARKCLEEAKNQRAQQDNAYAWVAELMSNGDKK